VTSDQRQTPRQLIQAAEERFRQADLCYGHGTDNPRDEAVYLVLGALGLPFTGGEAALDKPLDAATGRLVLDLISRRVRDRIPVAYLIHQAWFCGLCFYVDERVLIPRSPLAELIEVGFAPWMMHRERPDILDIGTGSGCIAIACAMAFPGAAVDAIDVSNEAMAVARMNIERHKVADRVHLVQSDLYANLNDNRYDLIIANPPYVGSLEFAQLPPEYHHEPGGALLGGEDGLDLVRNILNQSGPHLNDDGILVVEVGNGQGAVADNFPQLPFTWLEFERGGEGVFLLTAEDLARRG
jgi:ribosomal protein L3 glutamine methyltransferase